MRASGWRARGAAATRLHNLAPGLSSRIVPEGRIKPLEPWERPAWISGFREGVAAMLSHDAPVLRLPPMLPHRARRRAGARRTRPKAHP